MKKILLLSTFVIFVCNANSQILYDYVQDREIWYDEFVIRYGKRFYNDVNSINESMRYASKESNESFQEAIKTRQFMIEKTGRNGIGLEI